MPIMREMDYLNKLSDKDIDSLIDNLCTARENNPDIMIMDQIKSGHIPITEEDDEALVMDAMVEDIIDNAIHSGIPLSIEEVNSFKTAGIYNKYLEKLSNYNNKEDNTMSSIEEELRQGLINSETKEEVPLPPDGVTTATIESEEQSSFQEAVDVIEDTVSGTSEEITESLAEVAQELVDTVEKVTSPEAVEEELNLFTPEAIADTGMTVEDFNDVPATQLNLSDDVLANAIKDKYSDVSTEDAMKLISVINRYKNHEKFSVFEALPDAFKEAISKEAMAAGADRSTIEFFSKSFINDIVNNTYIDNEIKDFNEELKNVLAPMNNIAGYMMDEYSDEVAEKFTTNMLTKADEIQSEDPEKAEELRAVSKAFTQSITFERIKDLITKTPSAINRAYKTARDNGSGYIRDYDTKVSAVNPMPRSLKYYKAGLARFMREFSENYLDAFIVLVADSVLDAINEGSLTEHIYAYYTSNSVYTLAYTADNGKVSAEVANNVKEILTLIEKYMKPLEERNTRKNRKRNKR